MSIIEQLFITITAVAGSGALWKFFSERMRVRAEQRKRMMENNDTTQYRQDLKNRIEEMSKQLEEANQKILQLTEEVAELRTENKFLKKEIDILKNK